MDNLFTNVGAKLKAFAKAYFKITMWLLIIGGVIAFFALILQEYTAPYAFGVLFGVPLAIFSNLVSCWILHAFGSIAEKHEDGEPVSEPMSEPAAQPQEIVVETEESARAEQPDVARKKEYTMAAIVFIIIFVVILSIALSGAI